MEVAACVGADPEKWFLDDRAATDLRQGAVLICVGECPVRQECLRSALACPPSHGVWGGYTAEEIRAMLRRSQRNGVPLDVEALTTRPVRDPSMPDHRVDGTLAAQVVREWMAAGGSLHRLATVSGLAMSSLRRLIAMSEPTCRQSTHDLLKALPRYRPAPGRLTSHSTTGSV
jgi:hypothetical protein